VCLVQEASDQGRVEQHKGTAAVEAAAAAEGTDRGRYMAVGQTGHMGSAAFHTGSAAGHKVAGKAGHTGHTFAGQAVGRAAGE